MKMFQIHGGEAFEAAVQNYWTMIRKLEGSKRDSYVLET
jgi:hypothetical protein